MTYSGWYREFYKTTPQGEMEMRNAILDPDNLTQIRMRLAEMKAITHSDLDKRCAISNDQVRFLERILGSL